MTEYTVFAVDGSGTRLGEAAFEALKLRMIFNGVGTWTLEGAPDALGLIAIGGGIEVRREGEAFFSGILTGLHREGPYRLTLRGVDSLTHLRDRLALPDPAGPPFTSQDHDVRTGAAETVMREYVYYNAGAGARSERRVPGLTLATDLGRGATVTGRARFHNLLKLLQSLALQGGGLGFRIVDGEFQVYEPEDKTGEVKLSMDIGSLRDYDYQLRAPKATMVYAGGQGEGTARTIVLGENSAASVRWGRRIETFLDKRQTPDTDEIAAAIEETLDRAGEQVRLELTPEPLAQMEPVRDYWLGDTVTASIEGAALEATIRECAVMADGHGGETIVPVAGTSMAEALDALARLYQGREGLEARVAALERV